MLILNILDFIQQDWIIFYFIPYLQYLYLTAQPGFYHVIIQIQEIEMSLS